MSAHRVLRDLYRAYENVGVGVGVDPGASGTIAPTIWGQIYPIVTATPESRTLSQPVRPGIVTTIVLSEDSGDLTLTVTGGYNADADTSIVFDDAGDFVRFMSIDVGGTYYWRVIGGEGTDVQAIPTTRGDVLAAEHGVGAIGTAFAPRTYRYTRDGIIITDIEIDLTGLASVATADDIIGLAAGGAAYIGRTVGATCGYLYKIEMSCIETPAGGDDDINLVAGSAATDIYDGTVTGANVEVNGGNWSGGKMVSGTGPVTANHYFYLTAGTGDTALTYTAGQFRIRTYGNTFLS